LLVVGLVEPTTLLLQPQFLVGLVVGLIHQIMHQLLVEQVITDIQVLLHLLVLV
jgi:hypothetical protein